MDDGLAVEVVGVGENPGFECVFRCDADVTKHGARHLGEEAFYKVRPAAMFRREYEDEPALRLGGEPRLGLLGDVCRVIVHDHFDGGIVGTGG